MNRLRHQSYNTKTLRKKYLTYMQKCKIVKVNKRPLAKKLGTIG